MVKYTLIHTYTVRRNADSVGATLKAPIGGTTMTLTEPRHLAEKLAQKDAWTTEDLLKWADILPPETVLQMLNLLDELAVSVKALRHEVENPTLTGREKELLLLGIDADLAKYNAWKKGE